MLDINAYKNACDQLTLGTETLEEMIRMTEKQTQKTIRRPTRVLLVAAALVAALGITASAAELPAIQQFFAKVFVTVKSEDGVFAGLNIPSVTLEEQDGRTILILDGAETDITDTLTEKGEYLYEGEGYEIRVDAEGEAWLTAHTPDGDAVMTFSVQAMEGDIMTYDVVTMDEEESEIGIYKVASDESGSIEVTDSDGKIWNYEFKDGQPTLLPAE